MNGIRSSLDDQQIISYSKSRTNEILRMIRQERMLKNAGLGRRSFNKVKTLALGILIIKVLIASIFMFVVN